MGTPFAPPGPRPFNNATIRAKTNYGKIPNFSFTGIAPGTAPEVNHVNTVQPFGNPKAMLSRIPSIFKLLHQ